MHRFALTALAALLLAGCEEVVADDDDLSEYPFNAHVDVDVRLQEIVFVARVENAVRTPEPNAAFTVTLYNGPLYVAAGSASTGPLAPSEARAASVAFTRSLVWNCFQWSIATQDGRRRTSEVIC
jgi:hypothetical protein